MRIVYQFIYFLQSLILRFALVHGDYLFINVPDINTTPVQGTVGHVVEVTGPVECAIVCTQEEECDAMYYQPINNKCITVHNQLDDLTVIASVSGMYYRSKGWSFVKNDSVLLMFAKSCSFVDYQYAWDLDTCIKFRYDVGDKLNWSDAQALCESEAGNLIALDSEFKDKLFIKYLQNTYESVNVQRWWIGANDNETEGTFKWVNGNTMTYSHWQTDQPDDKNSNTAVTNADCAQYFYSTVDEAFSWYDITCDQKLAFICENRQFP